MIITLSSIAATISAHHWGDLFFFFLFFTGQCLWVLICAAAAIRSQHNPIKSRRVYVKQNIDIFLIRFAVEWLFVFYPWRHYSVNDILTFFHMSFQLPISGGNGPFAGIALGLGADTILNAIAKWQKGPDWFKPIQAFIRERIPEVPLQQVAEVKTVTTITPTDEEAPVTTKTTTAKVMAPERKDTP